jgi:serine protease Do
MVLPRRASLLPGLLGLALVAAPLAASAEAPAPGRPTTLPAPLLKSAPESVQDLRVLQDQLKSVVARVSPAVVGLRVNRGQGSGVIVTPDGYILTAGHVSGDPGQSVTVLFPDGKRAKARTLGANHDVDGGLIKLTDPAPPGGWPFVEMGASGQLRRAQWCVALGHPGGYKTGRTPPVRLGRVLDTRADVLRTDCVLVGGDSGGPLFDIGGRVIAIHSRIGPKLADNLHVPVDTYRDQWDRLAAGDVWGRGKPFLGVEVAPGAEDCRIGRVLPDSPAAKAGMKDGDVVTAADDLPVHNFNELLGRLTAKKPGDEITLSLLRDDGETVSIKVKLGRRPQ